MTTSTEHELSRKGKRSSATPWGRIAAVAAAAALAATTLSWPSPRWRQDPVGFTRTVLGIEPWDKQREVLEALRDHDRVAVASGHRVSKSNTAACAAHWWYGAWPEARVIFTSVTARQVDDILWRETKRLHAKSGRCIGCVEEDAERERESLRSGKPFVPGPRPCPHSYVLDGTPMELARSGLTGDDGLRQIRGFTAREAEAFQGIAGPKLLFIVDEASGVQDAIYEALEGNRAGGGKILLLGNPTRNEGEHYEAFHGKSEFYKTIRISSEDSPNVRAGREVVPGLATADWVAQKEAEWGRESALFQVRVLGQHAKKEAGKVISLHLLGESEKRWDTTPAEGRLFVGIDPAGPSGEGDESAFSVRRGKKQIALVTHQGLTGATHLVHLLGLVAEHKRKREQKPVVVVDSLGIAGAELVGTLRAHLETYPDAFELVCVRGSDKAVREPLVYENVRDELWANLLEWMKDDGAVLSDAKLAKELHAGEWDDKGLIASRGRRRVIDKKQMRKALGRSPDRADATMLSVWEPLSLAPDNGSKPKARDEREDLDAYANARAAISPYGGSISPYGGRG